MSPLSLSGHATKAIQARLPRKTNPGLAKTIALALLCWLVSGQAFAQLKGNYTIDPSKSASSTNYKDFHSAICDLDSGKRYDGGTANGKGISGAVTIRVANGTYKEKNTITAIPGSSPTNKVLFTTNDSTSTKVIMQADFTSTTSSETVLTISNASNISFYWMSFNATSSVTSFYTNQLIFATGAVSNLTLAHCIFTNNASKYTGAFTSYDKANTVDSNLVIDHNVFKAQYFAIQLSANAASVSGNRDKHTGVTNNICDSNISYFLFAPYQDYCRIDGNIIRSAYGKGGGIYLENSSNLISISNNRIATTDDALDLAYLSGTATSPALISNNTIRSGNYGISIIGCSRLDIVHNNVYVSPQTHTDAIGVRFFYLNGKINFNDNNVELTYPSGWSPAHLEVAMATDSTTFFSSCDYNNYSTNNNNGTSDSLCRLRNKTVFTLADWQSLTGLDAHSKVMDPKYDLANYLKTGNASLAGKGTPIASVKYDILGKTRNTTHPTIGAYELSTSTRLAPGFTYAANSICSDSSVLVSFTDTSNYIITDSIVSWLWRFGNGTTSTQQNPTCKYADSGKYAVTLVVKTASGNKDSIRSFINVYKGPAANFSTSGICSGIKNIQFTDLTAFGPNKAVKYAWDFGDGKKDSVKNPVHSYDSIPKSGYWNTTLTVTTDKGCTSTVTQTLYAAPQITMNFTNTCDSLHTVYFTDSEFVAPTLGIQSRIWYFGDGDSSSAKSPSHTYTGTLPTSGYYTVTLKLSSKAGCTTTISSNLSPISIGASIYKNLSSCGVVVFDDSLTNPVTLAGHKLNFLWVFGDGDSSISRYPRHQYSTGGTYHFSVALSSGGCTVVNKDSVTINPYVGIGGYVIANNTCTPDSMAFIDSSKITSATKPYLVSIDFGDGTTVTGTSATFGHQYRYSGTYTMTHKIKDATGCTNSYTQTISVHKTLVPAFTANNACLGQKVTFLNSSVDSGGTIASTFWNFGDDAVFYKIPNGDTARHVYVKTGVYFATLKVKDAGCTELLTKKVVISGVAAHFSFNDSCLNANTQFTSTSTDSGSAISHTQWSFGDGDSSSVFYQGHYYHNYKSTGVYTVTLTVGDGTCTSTTSKNITITGAVAQITAPAMLCMGDSIHYYGSDKNGGSGNTYHWIFGSRNSSDTSSVQNPVRLYSSGGFKKAWLIITNPTRCAAIDSTVVFVDSNCVWPGDADYNKTADIYDVLPIGIAYGDSGTQRPNASSNWTAQPAYDWGKTFASHLNHKHADCNGDGKIDSMDLYVISANIGKTHLKTLAAAKGSATDPPLAIKFSKDSVAAGDTVTAFINLGSSSIMANNVYGIAMGIAYNSTVPQPQAIIPDFSASWLGTINKNMVSLVIKDSVNKMIYIGLTRTDHKSMSGNGEIGALTIVMPDNLGGKARVRGLLNMYITNHKCIKTSEVEIPLNPQNDSVIVYEDASGIASVAGNDINIKWYPNPVTDVLHLNLQNALVQNVLISDIVGKTVYSVKYADVANADVSMAQLSPGLYIMDIKTSKGNTKIRFVKE